MGEVFPLSLSDL